MKLSFFSLLFFFIIFMVNGACSSGHNRPKGKQCESDYKPLPLDVNTPQVKKLDPTPQQTLPFTPGKYSYLETEYFYENQSQGIKIHVKNSPDKRGKLNTSVLCARGMKKDLELSLKDTGIKTITIDSNGKSDYTVFQISIQLLDGILKSQLIDDDLNPFPSKPTNPLELQAGSKLALYQLANPSEFEIRSLKEENGQNQTLVVRYRLVP